MTNRVKESEFINYLDIISNGCRIKNGFIKNWRKKSLENAIVNSIGYTDTQRVELTKKAKELGMI